MTETTVDQPVSALRAERREQAFATLPDVIFWAEQELRAAVRPGAFIHVEKSDKGRQVKAAKPLARGGTALGGILDVPAMARWAGLAKHWNESWYDGESLCLQLNLADIPDEVRRATWPTHGVLWVTLDLSGDHWVVNTYFDSLAAQDIVWAERHVFSKDALTRTLTFKVADTMPSWSGIEAIDKDLSRDGLMSEYETWSHLNFPKLEDVQIGGHSHPIQGDAEQLDPEFFLAMERQEFGDFGAIYVTYTPEKGFSGWATTN